MNSDQLTANISHHHTLISLLLSFSSMRSRRSNSVTCPGFVGDGEPQQGSRCCFTWSDKTKNRQGWSWQAFACQQLWWFLCCTSRICGKKMFHVTFRSSLCAAWRHSVTSNFCHALNHIASFPFILSVCTPSSSSRLLILALCRWLTPTAYHFSAAFYSWFSRTPGSQET